MGPKLVKGALNWIRSTYPKAFADEADMAARRAWRTGNEHAVVLTDANTTLPYVEGERYSVTPRYPVRKSGLVSYEDPTAINALLHTHPLDDFAITAAPSSMDLALPFQNRRGKPIRHTIIAPENDTFVDYTRQIMFPDEETDRFLKKLMFHTKSDINGVEPSQNDVNLAILRRLAEQKKATLEHQLGPEEDYFNEVYNILTKKLGLKCGGLVQMRRK